MIRFHNICNNLLFRRATLRMQLSQPAYLRYESGERTPSIHVIYYMAHILGTSADYLTGKSDDPTPNRHYIYEVEKPELFSLIEKVKNCDSDTQKRLLSYCCRFCKLCENSRNTRRSGKRLGSGKYCGLLHWNYGY